MDSNSVQIYACIHLTQCLSLHYVYEVKFNEDVVSHDYKLTVFINLLLLQYFE